MPNDIRNQLVQQTVIDRRVPQFRGQMTLTRLKHGIHQTVFGVLETERMPPLVSEHSEEIVAVGRR
jgi:hypothetical protein